MLKNDASKNNDIAFSVMKEITDKKLQIKSPLYFIFGSAMLTIGFVCSILTTVYLINLVLYLLRIYVPFKFLDFGLIGIQPFIETFPWLHLVIAVLAIIIGIELLKQYDFSYHKNFLALVLIILISTVGIGFLLDQVGLNEAIEHEPNLHVIYGQNYKGEVWIIGKVVEVDYDNNRLIIQTPQGEKISIIEDEKTIFPSGLGFFLGMELRIVGNWQGDIFKASGIMMIPRVRRYQGGQNIKDCFGDVCK